jgi:hypothetical protein
MLPLAWSGVEGRTAASREILFAGGEVLLENDEVGQVRVVVAVQAGG